MCVAIVGELSTTPLLPILLPHLLRLCLYALGFTHDTDEQAAEESDDLTVTEELQRVVPTRPNFNEDVRICYAFLRALLPGGFVPFLF